jgi:hypothetical protein
VVLVLGVIEVFAFAAACLGGSGWMMILWVGVVIVMRIPGPDCEMLQCRRSEIVLGTSSSVVLCFWTSGECLGVVE